MVATTGDPAHPVIIHTSKVHGAELTSSYGEEKAALLLALDLQGPTAPLSASQYGLTANPHLRIFRAAHTIPSLFASD